MYKYTFSLDSGVKDHMIGETLSNVVTGYFQLRGTNILRGDTLVSIEISGRGKGIQVDHHLIEKLVKMFKKQNSSIPISDVKISQYEDWCDDVPYH